MDPVDRRILEADQKIIDEKIAAMSIAELEEFVKANNGIVISENEEAIIAGFEEELGYDEQQRKEFRNTARQIVLMAKASSIIYSQLQRDRSSVARRFRLFSTPLEENIATFLEISMSYG